MDLRPPKAISPQLRGTGNRPTNIPPPKAADTTISGRGEFFVDIAIEVPDEVMLAGELIAVAKMCIGAGNGLSRSKLVIAVVADDDCTGCPRLRSARGAAAIA